MNAPALPYHDFLARKMALAQRHGFEVDLSAFNPVLKPHQAAICQWAVRGGRRAIFCAFGLGKSVMQLEVARVTLEQIGGGRWLIVCPLGVRQEFARDAVKTLGWADPPKFVRSADEVSETGVYLTNYETVRDGRLDPKMFDGVSLDEASVLRSFGSKTYQTFLPLFEGVRFRFVATATPSPNRYKELIHYAGFLGVMDTGQALTRFFQRNSEKAGDLTLYPHKEAEFWLWLSSWAVFVQRPSDLGFSDDGYALPDMRIVHHEVQVDHATAGEDRDGQSVLFRDPTISVSNAAREKRDTLTARVEKMREIIAADPDAHFIIWHDLEDERRAIEAALPDVRSIRGASTPKELDAREQTIIEFSDGMFKHLAAKPVIAGSGCNFQRHCHKAIFLGVGFKFNDFIQAVHRIQRFQQMHRVEIHIIHAESERHVLRILEEKWQQHNIMVSTMSDLIRSQGLNHIETADLLMRSIGCKRVEARGEKWIAANNDTVEEARTLEADSVDLIVTSVPFANHYEYTPSYNDFGHTDSNAHFWEQMDYLTPELFRALKPGRLACVHVKDRVLFQSVTGLGAPTLDYFHEEAAFHLRKHGFVKMGMITVNTDVVRENNQTYRLGWSEQCKDGTKMGVGCPEYILLFRKPQTDRARAYADEPVVKDKAEYTRARWQIDAHAFWRSSGDRLLTAEDLAAMSPDALAKAFTKFSLSTIYDFRSHVRIGEALEARGALPSTFMSLAPGSHDPNIWHDVLRMRTLNLEQSNLGNEKHVCPLQLDIVERLIERFSAKGELVYDPFGGLMTVPYCAIGMGRRGRGVELNPGYFFDGVKYLEARERQMSMPSLLDLLEPEEVAA